MDSTQLVSAQSKKIHFLLIIKAEADFFLGGGGRRMPFPPSRIWPSWGPKGSDFVFFWDSILAHWPQSFFDPSALVFVYFDVGARAEKSRFLVWIFQNKRKGRSCSRNFLKTQLEKALNSFLMKGVVSKNFSWSMKTIQAGKSKPIHHNFFWWSYNFLCSIYLQFYEIFGLHR